MVHSKTVPAVLALEDGSIFNGISIGVVGVAVGEVVFNTSMTGYQEILTDPSYTKQLVNLTYPHIGNTGVNLEDIESRQVWAAGLIIRELSMLASSWRSTNSLASYLQENNIVAIADIDTRRLTRIIRDKGPQKGCIIAGKNIDIDYAISQANAWSGMQGLDLAKEVSVKKSFMWDQTLWQLETGYGKQVQADFNVVVYDYGIKYNILRCLADMACKLTIVPAQTPAAKVLAMQPDGVFLSNGPGDPAPCSYAIQAIKTIVDEQAIPLFGICLGHQLLALASGAKTIKMQQSHHGSNHPVLDLKTGKVLISAQNHGFAVDIKTLPENLQATHISLFDRTLQGIERTDRPAFGFQGHPEASPGPHDLYPLFQHFIELMKIKKTLRV